MSSKQRKRSISKNEQDLEASSKKIKNSLITKKDRKILGSLNLECFDEAYLDSINVLPPASWEDFNDKFKDIPFEEFSFYSKGKRYPTQIAYKTILEFIELYLFFSGFKGSKIGFWRKFLQMSKICTPNSAPFKSFSRKNF